MLKIILPLIPLVSLLVSCATTGQETSRPVEQPEVVTRTRIVDNSCTDFKPVYVSKGDILTDGTADQIRANNEMGAKKCGWKPLGK